MFRRLARLAEEHELLAQSAQPDPEAGETARLAMTIAIDKSDQALPKSGGIA